MKLFLLFTLALFGLAAKAQSASSAGVPGGSSTPKTTETCSGSYALNFAAFGDTAYEITLSADCAFTVADTSSAGTLRHLTLIIHPAGFQATLPAASGSLLWSGGSTPVPSTSGDTIIVFDSTSAGKIYAHLAFQ